jgi:hypothetical protein
MLVLPRTGWPRCLAVVIASALVLPLVAAADSYPTCGVQAPRKAGGGTQPKSGAKTGKRVAPTRVAARRNDAKEAEQPACHAGAGVPDPQVVNSPSQPLFKCDELTVSPEPTWAGKNLTATWSIRNEGKADLSIKLKGG